MDELDKESIIALGSDAHDYLFGNKPCSENLLRAVLNMTRNNVYGPGDFAKINDDFNASALYLHRLGYVDPANAMILSPNFPNGL